MNIESFEIRSIEDRNLVSRKFRISYTYFKELKLDFAKIYRGKKSVENYILYILFFIINGRKKSSLFHNCFPRVEVVVKNHLLNELFRIIYKCIIIVFDTFLMILFKMQN